MDMLSFYSPQSIKHCLDEKKNQKLSLLYDASPDYSFFQSTIKKPVLLSGVGLHTGKRVDVKLYPARPNHGIVFCRSDTDKPSIPALYHQVVDTRLCSVIGDVEDPSNRIGTIEHLMAALYALGLSNVYIEVSGPEVAIFDGSSESIISALQLVGCTSQLYLQPILNIVRPIKVVDGDSFALLEPNPSPILNLSFIIDFPDTIIGKQSLDLTLTPQTFVSELAKARTFARLNEIQSLQESGLIKGGSLTNAVVIDNDRVINPDGLRFPDEFVRHKLLDAVGDLALCGFRLCGRFSAYKSGHALNNRLLKAVFSEPANYRIVQPREISRFDLSA